MSIETQPGQDWTEYTTFASDQVVTARAVHIEGGTQFVYTTPLGKEITVLAARYDTWMKYPNEVHTIKAATDCTYVACWG